jgi:hypothetical protein
MPEKAITVGIAQLGSVCPIFSIPTLAHLSLVLAGLTRLLFALWSGIYINKIDGSLPLLPKVQRNHGADLIDQRHGPRSLALVRS